MVQLLTNRERLEIARAVKRERGIKGGRPKGVKNAATLEKDKEKKALDQLYLRAQRQLAQSQISVGVGQTFLFRIDKKKIVGPKGGVSYENQKPVLVTSQLEIEEYLTVLAENGGDISDDQDPEAAYYFLTTKEPNNEAIKDILNRVHGKPKETIEVDHSHTFTLRATHAKLIEPKHINALDITDAASGALEAGDTAN